MAAKGQTEATTCKNTNKIADEVGERTEEEKRNSTIGDACVNFKDFQNTINYLEICLKFFRQVGDRAGEGKAYCNLGNAYDSIGDIQKAIEYHKRHLKISKEVGDRAGAVSYTHLTLPTNREV